MSTTTTTQLFFFLFLPFGYWGQIIPYLSTRRKANRVAKYSSVGPCWLFTLVSPTFQLHTHRPCPRSLVLSELLIFAGGRELWENHHSDIWLTSLSPHYALALRLGKTVTTDFRICRLRATKPKQVPLLNLINGHKYCSCTVSYFSLLFGIVFPPSCIVGGSSFNPRLVLPHDRSVSNFPRAASPERSAGDNFVNFTDHTQQVSEGRKDDAISNYQNSISHKRTPLGIFSFAFETKQQALVHKVAKLCRVTWG